MPLTQRTIKSDPGVEPEPLIRAVDVPDLRWLPPGPRSNGRLNYSTVLRWILTGIKLRNSSEAVRLQAVRVGGTWCTRTSWLEKFFEASAAAKTGLKAMAPEAAQARAEKELRALGAMR